MAKDPTDFRSAEAARREASEARRRAEEENDEDMKAVLETERGRRFVWRQLRIAQLFSSPYEASTREADCALGLAYMTGRQDAARQAQSRAMRACPTLWMKMFKENANE